MSEKEELRAMFQELTEYEKQKVGLGIVITRPIS